jgi:hypothetical protein
MTLEKAVLNIEKKGFRPGLAYVGTLRVTSKEELLFETGFDYERFQVTPGQAHIICIGIDRLKIALNGPKTFAKKS